MPDFTEVKFGQYILTKFFSWDVLFCINDLPKHGDPHIKGTVLAHDFIGHEVKTVTLSIMTNKKLKKIKKKDLPLYLGMKVINSAFADILKGK